MTERATNKNITEMPTGGATILVVEDDADVREMVVGMLSELGYRTLTASAGQEALAVLEREKSVDLLFCVSSDLIRQS